MKISWMQPLGYSCPGQSHISNNLPCQDHHSILQTENGWVIATVCDGAGSAIHGGDGAQLFSNKFSQSLISLAEKIDNGSPGQWINDYIVESILNIRTHLRETKHVSNLNDWHTTLLAVLLGESGGLCVHIGDGAIFGGQLKPYDDMINIIDHKYYISSPENGEYSNETYFVTEGIWTKHLRISPLPALDWIALATDGGCSLCLNNQSLLNEHFVPSVLKEFANYEGRDIPNFIMDEIVKEKYKSATSDDKTVVFICNSKVTSYKSMEFATASKYNLLPSFFGDRPADVDLTPSILNDEPLEKIDSKNLPHSRSDNTIYSVIIPLVIFVCFVGFALQYFVYLEGNNSHNIKSSNLTQLDEAACIQYYKFDINKFKPFNWSLIKSSFLNSININYHNSLSKK